LEERDGAWPKKKDAAEDQSLPELNDRPRTKLAGLGVRKWRLPFKGRALRLPVRELEKARGAATWHGWSTARMMPRRGDIRARNDGEREWP